MSSQPPGTKRVVRYFVSYTRDDAKLPDKLLIELRKKLGACADYDFKPWRDTDIVVGADWDKSIQDALAECDFGLLLVSPAFLGKKYITEKELPHFVGGGKPCVPVTLSRIDFDEMDLKGLEARQFFGLVGNQDVHPRSFEECRTAPQKSAFALELFRKIKISLGDVFAEEAGPALPGASFDSAYRAHIRKHYRLLQLEALGGDGTYRDLELQQVFIPQDARDCAEWLPEKLEGPAELPKNESDLELAELHEHKRFRDTAPSPVLTLLDDSKIRCRIILGAPGAGKSSLARIRLLDWEKTVAGDKPLPILIELRLFHRSGREDFLDYLEQDKDVVFRFPQETLKARLQAGTVELIFDGLDEIFEPTARDTAAKLIARYGEIYPQAGILLTSRLIGYPGRILREAGFAHWLLADFDQEKIASFLNHWTADAVREPADRHVVRKRMEDALLNPVIAELAGNPLLLTLMAVLARKSDLPRDLGSVYARAADLLLEQWDTHRMLGSDIDLSGILIDQKDKHDLLRDLAWAMQTGQRGLRGNLISEAEVRAAMEAAFAHRIADPGLRRRAVTLLLEKLVERNYILCHVGGAQFAFVHRGFLEFFASEYLLNIIATRPTAAVQEIGKIYQEHAMDDAWREVLILAATRFDPAVADQILLPLIENAEAGEVGSAAYFGEPHCFVFVCSVLTRARDPQKLGATNTYARATLEEWLEEKREILDSDGWVILLASTFGDNATRIRLERLAQANEDTFARSQAVNSLAEFFGDKQTRGLLEKLIEKNENTRASSHAVSSLAEYFGDESTRMLLEEIAQRDDDTPSRKRAISSLARHFGDAQTRSLLEEIGRSVENTEAQRESIAGLGRYFTDSRTWAFLAEVASGDSNTHVRSQAIASLAEHFHNLPETADDLREIVSSAGDKELLRKATARFPLRRSVRAYLNSIFDSTDEV